MYLLIIYYNNLKLEIIFDLSSDIKTFFYHQNIVIIRLYDKYRRKVGEILKYKYHEIRKYQMILIRFALKDKIVQGK